MSAIGMTAVSQSISIMLASSLDNLGSPIYKLGTIM